MELYYIMSYIWSIILALLLTPYVYRIIEKYVLTEYHGPDSNVIKGYTYTDPKDKTCYRLVPVPYVCPL